MSCSSFDTSSLYKMHQLDFNCYHSKLESDYEKMTDVIYSILHQASVFKYEFSKKDMNSKKNMTPFTVFCTVAVHKIWKICNIKYSYNQYTTLYLYMVKSYQL